MGTVIAASQRRHVYDIKVRLVVWECPSCGIVYGIPDEFADDLRRTGGGYYCPNGHFLSWHESEADRERKKREAAEQRAASAEATARRQRERAEQAERSQRALRGVVTRTKNRTSKGVCPVDGCGRHFANLQRHMHTQHPDYVHEGD